MTPECPCGRPREGCTPGRRGPEIITLAVSHHLVEVGDPITLHFTRPRTGTVIAVRPYQITVRLDP